jgi:hypothetical protein
MKTEDEWELKIRPRPSQTIIFEIPNDTLDSLRKIAESRDMGFEALIRLYIGQGLRQDLSRRYADLLLESTAQVLARHIGSEDELSDILHEIRTETAGVSS